MEQKNIAELLKDCPRGMELDCVMYEDVYFDYVDELNIIHCYIPHTTHTTSLVFNQHGTPNRDTKSKCVIFPKDKTTWKGFQRPFKDGDIVATSSGKWIGITTGGKRNEFIPVYCVITGNGEFKVFLNKKETWKFCRFATEEEKTKLFQAIKNNGYNWNAETKTLEKLIEPKFKVGDRIKAKDAYKKYITDGHVSTITSIKDGRYWSGAFAIEYINKQDDWELVPNKFDITTLKPLQSVLVRDTNGQVWTMDLFSHKIDTNKRLRISFACVGHYPNQCIPYEGNEHLLGKTEDCDEYYKTWEK